MSDGRKVPDQNAPPAGSSDSAAAPQRTISSPGMPRVPTNPNMRAMSAARTGPTGKKAEGQVGQRIASEASNQFLNGLSMLKEMFQDFRSSDRFFKAKAGIIGGWAFISLVSIVIACPGQGVKTADLGARVIVLPNADRPKASPALLVSNTDDDPWENVIFTVNGKYKAIVDKVAPGGDVTLTPKNLLGPMGPMPGDERFVNAEMKTDDGKAELVKNGQAVGE